MMLLRSYGTLIISPDFNGPLVTILNRVVYLYIAVYSSQMVTLSYLISDETLEPRAFNIPASSTAIYPAPMTATFLMVK